MRHSSLLTIMRNEQIKMRKMLEKSIAIQKEMMSHIDFLMIKQQELQNRLYRLENNDN